MNAEGRQPLDGSHWTTAKLSTLLKNPIYVKADSNVYDYYDRHGTEIVTDVSQFTGEYGAQLYGHTKHQAGNPDWSDMRLVLLSHPGIVDSEIWLKCQRKLEKNRQITNSYSNTTSWLAVKVICEQCGHTMTTITMTPMWISIITTVIIRVPVAYGLEFLTRPEGGAMGSGSPDPLFISLLISWVMGAILTSIAYRMGRWKKKSIIKQEAAQEKQS